ncbi:MAG: hypothetical protein HWN66_08390 [Candidatus Helarchaeota archaeon]|nr:hypothetical protein [Candidatus Helarchaeota archaeon]
MGAGRVLIGVLFCIVAAAMIIVFVTLGLSVEEVVALGWPTSLFQNIFLYTMHPYSFIQYGEWSILAALAAGAFIGGLISKGAKSGLAVGSISFGLLFFLQLAVGVFFNFTELLGWYGFVLFVGGNVIIDIALCAGLLIVCGAIGGALTSDGED